MSDIRRRKENEVPHHPLSLELFKHLQERNDGGEVSLDPNVVFLMDSYFEVFGAFEDDQTISLDNRSSMLKEIVGALRNIIQAHGPITERWTSSAGKRVWGALKTYNRRRKQSLLG